MQKGMLFKTGQTLEPMKKPPITRDQLNAFAQASGDFNRIHLEDAFAKQAGFPGVIVHGMLSMSFLGDFISIRFPEPRFKIESLLCKFRKVTFPGDTLECTGEIRSVAQEGLLVVHVATRNQAGEITTEGRAKIRFFS